MKVIEATTDKTKQEALSIREQVFIEEQGVDPSIEHDKYDATAIHIVGYLNQKPIAAARVRIIDDQGKIQRVAILKNERGKGFGKQLMIEIESILKQKQIDSFYLNAQSHAIDFYQSIGYQLDSEPFYEAGIEHVTMKK